MSSPQQLVDSFILELARQSASSATLHIAVSDFDTLRMKEASYKVAGFGWHDSAPDTRFDLIAIDLPLGMPRGKIVIADEEFHVRRSWIDLYQALKLTADDGYCLALLEPPAFGMDRSGERFLNALRQDGVSLIGIINTPPKLLNGTSIRPVIAVFQRCVQDEALVAELSFEVPVKSLVSALRNKRFGHTLSEGIRLDPKAFCGFSVLESKLQIAQLKTQYKEYDSVSLGDIAIEIKAVRSGQKHEPKENAIYIPALGTSLVTDDISAATIKHHNLYQVVLSQDALSKYVAAFFHSGLGKLTLPTHRHGVVISRMPKSEVPLLQVALPPLQEQRKIVASSSQLAKLAEAVKVFRSELAVNPRNAAKVSSQVERMLAQIGALTESDKILSLARKGESATIEFKQTFGVDIKTQQKAKHIELSSLKTLVAFLNSSGGTLLVGVDDSGAVVGIDKEISKFHKSRDKFLLHFKNCLKQRIGEQFYPFIDQQLVEVNESVVLMVRCASSSHPCYLDGEDFYVRTNPATDKLQGPKLVEYVQSHFKS